MSLNFRISTVSKVREISIGIFPIVKIAIGKTPIEKIPIGKIPAQSVQNPHIEKYFWKCLYKESHVRP